MALFHTIWTLMVIVIFFAIVWWAWGRGRKQAFAEAARLPLEDDDAHTSQDNRGENTHG